MRGNNSFAILINPGILLLIIALHYFLIENGHCNTEGYLDDYCDGIEFKRHQLFSIHKNGLQLMFYYDDAEICNL